MSEMTSDIKRPVLPDIPDIDEKPKREKSKNDLREQLLRPIPPITLRGVLIAVGIIALLVWAFSATAPDSEQINRGKPPVVAIFDFLSRTVPPIWDTKTVDINLGFTQFKFTYPQDLDAIFQTIQMALVGTLAGVLLAIPFALLAARNTAPHPILYHSTRLFLNASRSVPELIYALIFVAAVGLGPFGGVLALAIGGIGSKGKLYAEAIEAIDPAQVQAVRATGANQLQTFAYGVAPQVTPLILGYSLLAFEGNVRAATILGIVGAGGIGLALQKYYQLFQYTRLMGATIMIVIMVTIIDRISDYLRKRFI